jgi:NAD(P)-dependent dehydrogenase (short-subunit alcohol dehydrogenase family)
MPSIFRKKTVGQATTRAAGSSTINGMGALPAFQSFTIIVLGFVVAHFFSRKAPQYPYTEVFNLFKAGHQTKHDAEGVVAVVTGSTSGMGKMVAMELYQYGATVIIASRDAEKAAAVMGDLYAANPGSKGKLVFGKIDTADLDSVREFATWINDTYGSLDYLVNNAGIHYSGMENSPVTNQSAPTASKQGYDLCFATNYLGHFLLTHLLLPKLTGRVVNVASALHFQSDGSALNPALGVNSVTPSGALGTDTSFKHRAQAYGVSKLANVMHTVELQKRLPGYGHSDLKVLAVDPGWVQTNLFAHQLSPLALLTHLSAFKPREGILSYMVALFDKDLQGGELVTNYVLPLSKFSWFDAMLHKLSQLSMRDPAVLALDLVNLLVQRQSYGRHTHRPSPECLDEKLTAAFYDWTLEELKSKGYIPGELSA